MKNVKAISLMIATGLSLSLLTSCQSSTDDLEIVSPKTEEVSPNALGVAIVNGLRDYPTDGFYILFESSSDETMTMSEEDYMLANAFANLIVRENHQESDLRSGKPEGTGWKVGGKGKGKADAIKIGFEIADKIEVNRDFEVHVEYNEDGTYTVWYRELDKKEPKK